MDVTRLRFRQVRCEVMFLWRKSDLNTVKCLKQSVIRFKFNTVEHKSCMWFKMNLGLLKITWVIISKTIRKFTDGCLSACKCVYDIDLSTCVYGRFGWYFMIFLLVTSIRWCNVFCSEAVSLLRDITPHFLSCWSHLVSWKCVIVDSLYYMLM